MTITHFQLIFFLQIAKMADGVARNLNGEYIFSQLEKTQLFSRRICAFLLARQNFFCPRHQAKWLWRSSRSKRIFTAAHLGFAINKEFEVSNTECGRLSAQCVYICNTYDFAILKCEQLPEQTVMHGLLYRGREYCILVCF